MWTIFSWILAHKFEALVIASIVVILILALTRITSSSGTWSDTYYYVSPADKENAGSNRAPRRESLGETRVRNFLEKYFRQPFPKSRPGFLVNPVTGSQFNLELDCYNEALRLAVEYNGAQHYQYIPYFHRNKEAFYNQKYRDEMKRTRCREMGIVLIEVPHTEDKRLEDFLAAQLRAHGFQPTT
jgi:hypothetical protein